MFGREVIELSDPEVDEISQGDRIKMEDHLLGGDREEGITF